MNNFMPEDLSREHRQLLREQADKARLVKVALENRRNVNRSSLSNPLRRVATNLEWLWHRSPDSTEAKPIVARS